MDYREAKELMEKGAVMSYSGGDYDYYRIEEGVLIGFYSCDDEDFIIDNPAQNDWYFVYWGMKEPKHYLGKSVKIFLKDGGAFNYKVTECGLHHFGGFDDEGMVISIAYEDIYFITDKYTSVTWAEVDGLKKGGW